MTIHFFVPGIPVAQPRQRHRIVAAHGKQFVSNYDNYRDYELWRGGIMKDDVLKAIEARIFPKVTRGHGCWTYSGSHTAGGYGCVTITYRTHYVHRLLYERYVGPIPDGLQVLHRCDNGTNTFQAGPQKN